MRIGAGTGTGASPVERLFSGMYDAIGGRTLTNYLNVSTQEMVLKLGNTTQTLFYFGDYAQQAALEGFFDLLYPQTWLPTNLARLAFDATRESVQISRVLLPGQPQRLALMEFRNKLEIFTEVKNIPDKLQFPKDQLLPLPDLVARTYTLPPFLALWAVEGLGEYYTTLYTRLSGHFPQRLLWEENAKVPEKSLLMLHAGLGLSFANNLLSTVSPSAPRREIHNVIKTIVTLCRENSREGYLGAALESLGLVTRVFYPTMPHIVHQELEEIAPEYMGFFWHGYGRALYFGPAYFVPVLRSAWGALDSEITGLQDELSAAAGTTWAMTLVNMRQPEIVEGVLKNYLSGSRFQQGFVNGVSCCIVMRQDTTPDEPFVSTFYRYRPDASDPQVHELWDRCVYKPASDALNSYYPVLKQHNKLDQVFRFQDLAALVSNLQAARR
jgi:hypothetical protein